MSEHIRYKGAAGNQSFRLMEKESFEQMGVTDQEEVQWWGDGDVSEVSGAAAAALLERHPDEFELASNSPSKQIVDLNDVEELRKILAAAEAQMAEQEEAKAQEAAAETDPPELDPDLEGRDAVGVDPFKDPDAPDLSGGPASTEAELKARAKGSPPATGDDSPAPEASGKGKASSGKA